MAILVTGSTGSIGAQVLAHLEGRGVDVRALTRSPDKAKLPVGVEAVRGDTSDLDAVRAALVGVRTVFVLVPNVADELTQAMLTLDAARDAGVTGIVYLSVFRSAEYADVPHFTGKHAVERMIEQAGLPATVLRPLYFMQNDERQQQPLTKHGVYAMPIGAKGVSMVDTRDIGEAAARELVRRERSAAPLPQKTVSLVGPDALDGARLATIWSEALGRPIRYGGDDLDAMEARLAANAPAWLARDMRLMMRRYQVDGAVATPAELDETRAVLGREPRGYRSFAKETAARWREGT